MDISKYTEFEKFAHYTTHIAPAGVQLGDLIMNRVPFSRRRAISVIVPMIVIYGGCNIAISLIRGEPIYPPLDPKKPICYLFAACLPLFSALIFILWEWHVDWKLKMYE